MSHPATDAGPREPQTDPAINSETDPAINSETDPGVNSDTDPRTDPETEPRTDPDLEELEVDDGVTEEEELELDPEIVARRAAALAHVRKFGDPVLKTRARPVDRVDDALRDQIRRMGELMIDALGVGLAATQVGVLNRVLVYRVHPQAPFAALINPEIEWSGKDAETMEEGCLSLPAVHVDVERAVNIRIRALDENGDPIMVEASGLEARVIQHEIDHLDGVLILDRISRQQRKEAMRALREAQDDR